MTCVNASWGTLLLDDVRFRISEVRGWLDSPPVDEDLTPSPSGVGDLDTPGALRSRLVQISGFCNSRADRDTLVDELRAGTTGRIEPLTITIAGRQLQTPARVVGRSVEPQHWPGGLFSWSVTFRCPDPTLYGVDQLTLLSFPTAVPGSGLQYPLTYPLTYGTPTGEQQQVVVPNGGTVPLWPRIRIEGPVVRPRLYVAETGAQLVLDLTVAAGSWLDVLCRDRRVLANGVASRRFAATYTVDWLAIPPGGATVGWDADVQDPTARAWLWAPTEAWI